MTVRRTVLGRALPDRRAARVWGPNRQLSPDRADAGRHLHLLRRWTRPRVATQYRHGRTSTPAGQCPPVVWRLAWPLGGRHPRYRRDEFQSEDGFSGLTGELAFGRALDADRADYA